jgi:hypothetical protein
MILIMQPEDVWEILGPYQCKECLRCLKNHNLKENRTCHDHALSNVTLVRKVARHNPHRRKYEKAR